MDGINEQIRWIQCKQTFANVPENEKRKIWKAVNTLKNGRIQSLNACALRMSGFCFSLCGILPRCSTCCGLPLRVGALLVGIITLVLKVISVGTDMCLIEQTWLPPLNTPDSTIILEMEYIYLYVALAIDLFILILSTILQCGVVTSNSTKVLVFNVCFLLDWARLLGIVIYEVVLYVEDRIHPISTSICEDLSAFYVRVCVAINLFFFLIVNSYHHKMVIRNMRNPPLTQRRPTVVQAGFFPVYGQPAPQPLMTQPLQQSQRASPVPLSPQQPHIPQVVQVPQTPQMHQLPQGPHIFQTPQGPQMLQAAPQMFAPTNAPLFQLTPVGYSPSPEQQGYTYAQVPVNVQSRPQSVSPSRHLGRATHSVMSVPSRQSVTTTNHSSRPSTPSSYPSDRSL